MLKPKIATDADPRRLEFLRTTSERMVGKTIKRVSCAEREHDEDCHESDVLEIEFTDGSTLYIHTASNAQNIRDDVNSGRKRTIQASDFHADLHLAWED